MQFLERRREKDIFKKERKQGSKQEKERRGEERGSEKKFSFQAYAHHLLTEPSSSAHQPWV